MPVIATRLPLTEEIVAYTTDRGSPAPILLCNTDATTIIDNINSFTKHNSVQRSLRKGIDTYCGLCSFPNLVDELIAIYREISGV